MALFQAKLWYILFSIIFIPFPLFYFPGYDAVKSKSGNIETVFEALYWQSF